MGPEPNSSGEETSDAVMLEKREQIPPEDDVKVPHTICMGCPGRALGHLSERFATIVTSLGDCPQHSDLLSVWWVNGSDLGMLPCEYMTFCFWRRGVLVEDDKDWRL